MKPFSCLLVISLAISAHAGFIDLGYGHGGGFEGGHGPGFPGGFGGGHGGGFEGGHGPGFPGGFGGGHGGGFDGGHGPGFQGGSNGGYGGGFDGGHGPGFPGGFGGGHGDGLGGYGGPGDHGPHRILKVQELDRFHGSPHGHPLLIKVFYKNEHVHGVGPHPHIHEKIVKVIHPVHEDHKVIKVIHENHPHIHAGPGLIKVIHEHQDPAIVTGGVYAPAYYGLDHVHPAKVLKVVQPAIPLYADGLAKIK